MECGWKAFHTKFWLTRVLRDALRVFAWLLCGHIIKWRNPIALVIAKQTDGFPANWLVWGLAVVSVFTGLGGPGILDNNEGLYAEIPREMLASHDWRHWVIPHLNGLPYMEKPPLLYWLTALSFALFGVSEWSARLTPALSALSCVGILLWLGQACGRARAGRLGALMFITGLGVTIMSRLLMFDMLLTALMTAALCCCYRYLHEGRPALLRWTMAWLALAILAKGLLGLLLFPLVIFSYLASVHGISARLAHSIRSLFRLDAWLILIAIAAPWHIVASLIEPRFPWFYFVNEHLLRFLGQREPRDYYSGPWWYYLPRMIIYLFPWSLFLLACLVRPLPEAAANSASLRRFLLLAWMLPLLFFSASRAKANYYLVMVMPFAALHLALALENRDHERSARLSWPGYAVALLGASLCVVAWLRADDAYGAMRIFGLSEKLLLVVIFVALALLGLCCAWFARHFRQGLAAYLALPVGTGCLVYVLLVAMQPQVSARELAQWLRRDQNGHEVYLYRNFEQISSLPFYLGKPLPVVDSQSSDLYWGNWLRDNDIVLSNEQFTGHLEAGTEVAIVMMDFQLADFLRQPYAAKLHEARRSGRFIVFVTPVGGTPAFTSRHYGRDSPVPVLEGTSNNR